MASSPCVLSMDLLRDRGYVVGKTEHWNQYAKIRQDLFGLFDLIALKVGEPGVLGVQCCAGSSHAAHRDKMQANPILATWWQTGNCAVIYSWAKQGPAGKRKVWTLRQERVYPPTAVSQDAPVARPKASTSDEKARASILRPDETHFLT